MEEKPIETRHLRVSVADTETSSILQSDSKRPRSSRFSGYSGSSRIADETEARKRLYTIVVIQYILIGAWFLVSIAIGTVFVRMSCWTVMIVQTCIFSFALHRIRNSIASVNQDDSFEDENDPSFETNIPLLRCN